ncbi:MAG: hypothetical protein ABIR32_00385 [Ilumatobacteraceae bacterium]
MRAGRCLLLVGALLLVSCSDDPGSGQDTSTTPTASVSTTDPGGPGTDAAGSGSTVDSTAAVPSSEPSSSTTTTTAVPEEILIEDEVLPDSSAAGYFVTQRLANNGRLPLDDALDLFAATFEPIEGGDGSALADIADVVDGTAALSAVSTYWDELNGDQQASVRGALGYTVGQSRRGPSAETMAAQRAVADEVDAAVAAISALTGRTLSVPIRTDQIAHLRSDAREVLGLSWPELDGEFVTSGRMDSCRISFSTTPPANAVTVAHEVYHCFQFDNAADVGDVLGGHSWIIEGSAEWAGETVAGLDDLGGARYNQWSSNTQSLYGLDYRAIGFYWVLESTGIDPWQANFAMLGHENLDAVTATGGDPLQILNRVGTSLARRGVGPALPVDGVWDFTPPIVPARGHRNPVTLTPEMPFEVALDRGAFTRSGPSLVTIEGGERVSVNVESDVGTLQFFDHDPISFLDSLHREFCLDPGGCRCGVDDSVGSELEDGSRELIVSAGLLEGGSTTYDLHIPNDVAFTDGHWTGAITTSVFNVDTPNGTAGTRHDAIAPFELTVENGAVTSGTYTLNFFFTVNGATGTGEGIGSVDGVYSGCGFSPQLHGQAFGFHGSVTTNSGISVPLDFDRPITGASATSTAWVFDAVTDPNRRTGELDPTADLAYIRSSGYGASDIITTFEATLDG